MQELCITILQKTHRSKFEDGTKTTICKVHRFLGIIVQKNSDYSPSNTAKNIYLA